MASEELELEFLYMYCPFLKCPNWPSVFRRVEGSNGKNNEFVRANPFGEIH